MDECSRDEDELSKDTEKEEEEQEAVEEMEEVNAKKPPKKRQKCQNVIADEAKACIRT